MKRVCFALILALFIAAPPGTADTTRRAHDDSAVKALVTSERAGLASSGQFYLELLLSRREIRLCHSGVWLASYPLDSIRAGYPRVLFISLERHENWIGAVWTKGHLSPPAVINRVEIVPGDDSTTPTPGEADVLPPTLEELIPVPPVYDIRFDNGLVIRVLLKGKIPGAVKKKWRIAGRWHDFLAALGLRARDKVRIEVTLSAAEGAALYRSFPAAPPSLLVVP
jgi:hypothetical protein